MPRDGMLFVDQENLRNGANEYDRGYKYDFVKLRDVLLEEHYPVRSYWFASWHPDHGKPDRFYEALEMSGYRVIAAPRVPRGDTYIEKGVDMQLATELLAHAFNNSYDTAFVVSGDADYRRAVEYVQDLGKKVVVAGWGSSSSAKIKRQSDKFVDLEEKADEIEKVDD